MPAGLHVVRVVKAGKPAFWYIYAWRGGPCIHTARGSRPKITAEISDKAADLRRDRYKAPSDLLPALIAAFRQAAEWAKLAKSTKANWETWFKRIEAEFGKAPIAAFNDRRMRGEILEWRDRWAAQPRAADMAIQAFSRVLSFGFDRGQLTSNILTGVENLYDADRSDIIWEQEHFDKFNPKASVEVQEGVELCASTGLRRGDLVRVPWTAVGEHAIIWKTGKSRGKAQIVIPLLPETKALLQRIKDRHAASGTEKPLPETILANSHWEPWTPSGFGSRFNDAKVEAGIDVHLHDLRGTFATRCMIAGLTDQEIADILGWSTKDVARIRVKYVNQARVVIALAERIAAASV
jgi:integrase